MSTTSSKAISREQLEQQKQLQGRLKNAGTAGIATSALRLLIDAVADELTAAKNLVEFASSSSDSEGSGGVAVFIPGVEGVAAPLEPLARDLPLRAFALQLPFNKVEPSVSAMIDSLMPLVRAQLDRADGSSANALLGYSYGGLLVLEAASHLEAEGAGRVRHVVLLDSAPDMMRAATKIVIAGGPDVARTGLSAAQAAALLDNSGSKDTDFYEEKRLQEELLVQITQTVLPHISPLHLQGLRRMLAACKDWDTRLRLLAERTLHTGHGLEYKMAAIDAIYRRTLAILRYRWPQSRPRLQAAVTLIRPSISLIPQSVLPADYGLSEICERPVRVHFVEGADHYTLLSKPQTAAFVKEALEEMAAIKEPSGIAQRN